MSGHLLNKLRPPRPAAEEDEANRRPRENVELELLLDLETLFVVSDCDSRYLTRLLSAALNVKHFKTGIHTKLTDQDQTCIMMDRLRRDV